MADNEPCNCGAPVTALYGPDIRFNPPCSKPMMWRAQCSANDCMDSPSFTAFTRERALELWDGRMRDTRGVIETVDATRQQGNGGSHG